MTNNPGSHDFTELDKNAKTPTYRKLLDWSREALLHPLGFPAGLEKVIKTGRLVPNPVTPPPDTCWMRSVTAWDEWLESTSFFFNKRCMVDYRKPDGTGHFQRYLVAIPEVENLITEEIINDFQCDIRLLKGMSSSKSEGYDISDINDLSLQRRPDLISPVTPEHLQEILSHGGLRYFSMRFAEYPWSERRYYWHNEDGSHHFSTARYLACCLQQPVTLTGTLYRYSVNMTMVSALCSKWRMFVIPKKELFGSFYESLKAFECPFASSELPENMHDSSKGAQELCIVWLERDNARSRAVANVLAKYSFPDFGTMLEGLARCNH